MPKLTRKEIDRLPLFITPYHLARILNRDHRTVMGNIRKGVLPKPDQVTSADQGWPKEIIAQWVNEHPEASNG